MRLKKQYRQQVDFRLFRDLLGDGWSGSRTVAEAANDGVWEVAA